MVNGKRMGSRALWTGTTLALCRRGGDDYGSMGAIRGTLALFIYVQAEVFDNLFSDFEFCGF